MTYPNHYDLQVVERIISTLNSDDLEIQQSAYTEFQDKVLFYNRSIGSFQEEPQIIEILSDDTLLILIPELFKLLVKKRFKRKQDLCHDLTLIADLYRFAYDNDCLLAKALQVRQQIWLYLPVIKQLLYNEDKKLQLILVRLLGRFSEYIDEILPIFYTSFSEFDDEGHIILLKVFIEHTLPNLVPQHPALVDFNNKLKAIFYITTKDKLRLYLAILSATIERHNTDSEIVSLLTSSVSRGLDTKELRLIIPVLSRLGYEKGIVNMLDLLRTLKLSESSIWLIAYLLHASFKVPIFMYFGISIVTRKVDDTIMLARFTISPPNEFRLNLLNTSAFSAHQKVVIMLLLELDWVWNIPNNLLQIFGLPESRTDLNLMLEN